MNHTLLHELDPDHRGQAHTLDDKSTHRDRRHRIYESNKCNKHDDEFDDRSDENAPEKVRSFADLQLELIVQRYQSRAGWIFYHDSQTGERHQLACHNVPNAELDIAYQTYLESQDFLDDITTPVGLRALTLDDQSVIYVQCLQYRATRPSSVSSNVSSNTYGGVSRRIQICLANATESQSGANPELPDYLLIWQPTALSPIAQDQLEQHILTLQKHLELEQTCQRQTTEIQMLEQLFQRIGHQLRHPLALLRLYTDNLARLATTEATQAQVSQMKGFLHELGERLTCLINSAQGGQIKRDACDFAALWGASVQELQPLITEKQLRVECSTTPICLPIDARQFRHVIDNVLHNAICFSPDQGQITCRWQLFQREALITITDQGTGLSAADLEHMFRPFYTNREDGTGLGLAIAQKIVLDHKGNLWAENLPMGGTQISITLPRYPTPS